MAKPVQSSQWSHGLGEHAVWSLRPMTKRDKREFWARLDPHAVEVLEAFLAGHRVTKTAYLEAVAWYIEARDASPCEESPVMAKAKEITDQRRKRPKGRAPRRGCRPPTGPSQ